MRVLSQTESNSITNDSYSRRRRSDFPSLHSISDPLQDSSRRYHYHHHQRNKHNKKFPISNDLLSTKPTPHARFTSLTKLEYSSDLFRSMEDLHNLTIDTMKSNSSISPETTLRIANGSPFRRNGHNSSYSNKLSHKSKLQPSYLSCDNLPYSTGTLTTEVASISSVVIEEENENADMENSGVKARESSNMKQTNDSNNINSNHHYSTKLPMRNNDIHDNDNNNIIVNDNIASDDEVFSEYVKVIDDLDRTLEESTVENNENIGDDEAVFSHSSNEDSKEIISREINQNNMLYREQQKQHHHTRESKSDKGGSGGKDNPSYENWIEVGAPIVKISGKSTDSNMLTKNTTTSRTIEKRTRTKDKKASEKQRPSNTEMFLGSTALSNLTFSIGSDNRCLSWLCRFVMFFNVLVALVGILMIIGGAWALFSLGPTFAMRLIGGDDPDEKTLNETRHERQLVSQTWIALWIFCITVGCVTLASTLLGCCGTLRKTQCCLIEYLNILFIISGIFIASGVLCIYCHSHLNEWLRQYLEESFRDYRIDYEPSVLQYLERSLNCCGVNGAKDYWKTNVTLSPACNELVVLLQTKRGSGEKNVSKFIPGCLHRLYQRLWTDWEIDLPFSIISNTLLVIGGILFIGWILTMIATCLLFSKKERRRKYLTDNTT